MNLINTLKSGQNNIHSNYSVLLSVVTCVLCTISITCYSQTANEKKLFSDARAEMAKANYFGSKAFYNQLLLLDSNNVDYNFELGLAYYYSNVNREKSVHFFEKAEQLNVKDTIPEIYYYLARSHHFMANFELAIKYYLKFKEYTNTKNSGTILKRDVDRYIDMCHNGILLYENQDTLLVIENLGENINSTFPEYASVVNHDESVMIFTSRKFGSTGGNFYKDKQYFEDIYVSHKENGEWIPSTKFDATNEYVSSQINSKWHDAAIAYFQDEKTLFIYRQNNVWESHLVNGKWSDPVQMNSNINTKGQEPSVYLNKAGTILILTSNRLGGMGGRDLYISSKLEDGSWGPAKNLGKKINTTYDEDAPFLTDDGDTLFFSSTGHNTMGGYDIFRSVKDSVGNWGNPINLEPPFNTPAHDIYYTQNKDATIAYLSSNRAWGFGDMDIYRLHIKCMSLPLVKINGLVVAGTNLQPIQGGKIVAFNLNTGERAGDFKIDSVGKYLLKLTPENSYRLELTANDYEVSRPHVDTITLVKQCLDFKLFQKVTIKRYRHDVAAQSNQVFDKQQATFHNALFNIKSESEKYFKIDDLDAQIQKNIDSKAIAKYNFVINLKHSNTEAGKNIKLYLLNDKKEIVSTTLTDADGDAAFYNLGNYNYSVMIDEKSAKQSYERIDGNASQKPLFLNGTFSAQKLPYDPAVIRMIPLTDVSIAIADTNRYVVNATLTNNLGSFEFSEKNIGDFDLVNQYHNEAVSYNLMFNDGNLVYDMFTRSITPENTLRYDTVIDVITMPVLQLPNTNFTNILFDMDSFVLREKSKNTLDNIAEYLQKNPDVNVVIVGFTDWLGSDDYNIKLSSKRTNAAYKYLIKEGVNKSSLTKEWLGETKPIASNAKPDGSDDPIGRQLNRRCEFQIIVK